MLFNFPKQLEYTLYHKICQVLFLSAESLNWKAFQKVSENKKPPDAGGVAF